MNTNGDLYPSIKQKFAGEDSIINDGSTAPAKKAVAIAENQNVLFRGVLSESKNKIRFLINES